MSIVKCTFCGELNHSADLFGGCWNCHERLDGISSKGTILVEWEGYTVECAPNSDFATLPRLYREHRADHGTSLPPWWFPIMKGAITLAFSQQMQVREMKLKADIYRAELLRLMDVVGDVDAEMIANMLGLGEENR